MNTVIIIALIAAAVALITYGLGGWVPLVIIAGVVLLDNK